MDIPSECRAFSCLPISVFLPAVQAVADRSLTKAALSIAANSPAGNPAVLSPSFRRPLPPLRWLSRASALPSSSPSRTPPRSACLCSPDFPCRVSPPWIRPSLRMISGLHPYPHLRRPVRTGFSVASPLRVAPRTRLSCRSGLQVNDPTTPSADFWQAIRDSHESLSPDSRTPGRVERWRGS